MYIDNTNLLKRFPLHSHWTFNKHNRASRVFRPCYIRLYIDEKFVGTEVFSNDELFFPRFFGLLKKARNIKVVYTKLDVGQTNKQIKNNKYYKSFIGDKQIMKEYE